MIVTAFAGNDVTAPPEQMESLDDQLLQAARTCEGFDAFEELEQAVRHTRETRFGKTGQFVVPLSRQFLGEMKRYFPPDGQVFADSDKLKLRIERSVTAMRLLTVTVFAAYAFAVLAVVRSYFGPQLVPQLMPGMLEDYVSPFVKGQTPLLTILGATILVLLLSAVSVLVRRQVRSVFFLFIRTITTEFSHNLSSRYEDINKRIVECCLAAGRRGPSWHLRAKLYTIVATWNAKRSEYLDRYSTISAWKIRWFVTWAERVSTSLKMGMGIAVASWASYGAWLAGTAEAWAFAALVSASVMTTAVVGFFTLGRLPNDEWTRVLTGDISMSEQKGKHYFYRISELVENLARTVLEVQRTPPSASTGGTLRPLAAE